MHAATPPSSRFQVLEVTVQAVETLRPVVARIRQRDRDLGEQIRRALSSVALNIGEGNRSEGGNRLARFSTAAGSNAEVRAAEEAGPRLAPRDARRSRGPACVSSIDSVGAGSLPC